MNRSGGFPGRRAWLCLGLVLLVVSAAERGVASTGEVEGAAYGGTTAGGWICGPLARANYGGLGANVRLSEREVADEEGRGLTANLGAAAEYETVEIVDPQCDQDCTPEDSVAPPDAVLVGARARGGYHWKEVGIEGGVMVFQGWENNTDEKPSLGGFPELELSLGPRDEGHLVLGLGSPLVTTMRRPGAYLGGGVPLGRGHQLDLRAGVHRQGPALGDGGPRGDAVYRYSLSDDVSLRAGASISSNDDDDFGAEGSLGATAKF